ncbi:SDR family NAD(P)-dependent oxidoreductase [Hahella aquimaris]|uniref:SDR family NAD(P)-dependent oxidoreductase n=1 Tax=Hahella sp. HNIBRBA332 TaxID=3015983 RepID=UPI00273AD24D|nr:SDR family NAD(P)-dependent oxidoreductase [Hahella sp. HNIBRBA332]WLQ16680.1 SDR family NAD(P)-dependent oxidoreductase [Hahella sp. HNIBRBA332]
MNSFEDNLEAGADSAIAIVGMACRFPGADTPEAFWRNLVAGVESVAELKDAELDAAGIPKSEYQRPDYVRRVAALGDVSGFDAALFDMNPKESQLLDPQHRLLLECAWEALERACCNPDEFAGPIGVFAGCGMPNYFYRHVLPNTDARRVSDLYQAMLLNDKDFLSTRIAYKLGLTGPAVGVQTACSTSLMAVHLACQSLLAGDCDLALAGGASVQLPQHGGFRSQSGMILSPRGQCRAFDAEADGTAVGSGAGLVALKRLDDALENGDRVLAVIRATAANNDGRRKVGFTAPSVQGQAEVIREAQLTANIDPRSIQYVEAHGTGTHLGDPIEIEALARAFDIAPSEGRRCAIGSVKTNIGHLDAAAGVAGLIKTVLCLHYETLPPSLHCQQPNPQIDWLRTPFRVCSETESWPRGDAPRLAAVSAFGMGGSNVHAILEEAPLATRAPRSASRQEDESAPSQLLLLSAAGEQSADQVAERLAQHLDERPHTRLDDLAYTLALSKKALPYRAALAVATPTEAIAQLRFPNDLRWRRVQDSAPSAAFMFPGQGAQYAGMGAKLYQTEPVYRQTVEQCLQAAPPLIAQKLRPLLTRFRGAEADQGDKDLKQTALAQPALFIVDYAMAMLLQSWGLIPQALIGHSLGEYVAACVAGVFSPEDGVRLVAERGRLMQSMPAGTMIAVRIPRQQAETYAGEGVSLAVANGPQANVFAGPPGPMENFAAALEEARIGYRRLQASHAFHTPMMEPMLDAFAELLDAMTLQAPRLPVYSNLSGARLSAEQAVSADYWRQHLRRPVQFYQGLQALCADTHIDTLLEVGPGRALTGFASALPQNGEMCREAIATFAAGPGQDSRQSALECVGRLWSKGFAINRPGLFGARDSQFIATPTYPFDRRRYWIDPPKRVGAALSAERQALEDWFYTRSWSRLSGMANVNASSGKWLLLTDTNADALTDALIQGLSDHRPHTLVTVTDIAVTALTPHAEHPDQRQAIALPADTATDPAALFALLAENDLLPDHVLFARNLNTQAANNVEFATTSQDLSLLSALLHQLGALRSDVFVAVATTGTQSVLGSESLRPDRGALLGPLLSARQEFPALRTLLIDVEDASAVAALARQAPALLALANPGQEADFSAGPPIVALRGRHAWRCEWRPCRIDSASASEAAMSDSDASAGGGVYLITGGLGQIGLALANGLAQRGARHIALVSRTPLPPRELWPQRLDDPSITDKQRHALAALLRMQEAGASVSVTAADVTDANAMGALLDELCHRYGAIDAVIHAAADMSRAQEQPINADLAQTWETMIQAKVEGVRALARQVAQRPVRRVICMSSLAALLGGYQMGAYAAANLVMDLEVAQCAALNDANHAPKWLSLNWDAWRLNSASGLGMGANAKIAQEFFDKSALAANAIDSKEGFLALEHALRLSDAMLQMDDEHQVAISTLSLKSRFHRLYHPRRNVPGHDAGACSRPHSVPPGSSGDHAPGDHAELMLCDILGELLAVPIINVKDNFFDLGGDSLIATQAISRIRERCGADLSLADFFQYPSVRELAALTRDKTDGDSAESGQAPAADAPTRVEIEL